MVSRNNLDQPPKIFRNDPYTLNWINKLIRRITDIEAIDWEQVDKSGATEWDNSDNHIIATSAHGVTGSNVGTGDFCTDLVGGVVLKSAAVADAVSSSVSVTSADAGGSYTTSEQALINELKADVNTLTTNLNAAIAQINALLAAQRAANQLST